MLTADAFGVLPPIARLTRDQAMYYFLSGYTAKVAGTEIGVAEPQATFSTCFGAPFLPQPPAVYAGMLGEKLDRHGAQGLARQHRLDGRAVRRGPADADRGHARAAARGARRARSTASTTAIDPVFGFEVPVERAGRRRALLDPRSTWRDPEAYDAKARELARMFRENFAQFTDTVDAAVTAADPARDPRRALARRHRLAGGPHGEGVRGLRPLDRPRARRARPRPALGRGSARSAAGGSP